MDIVSSKVVEVMNVPVDDVSKHPSAGRVMFHPFVIKKALGVPVAIFVVGRPYRAEILFVLFNGVYPPST